MVAALKTATEGEDVEAIKANTQALMRKSSMKLGEAMYKANQKAAGGGGARRAARAAARTACRPAALAAPVGDAPKGNDGKVVDADSRGSRREEGQQA